MFYLNLYTDELVTQEERNKDIISPPEKYCQYNKNILDGNSYIEKWRVRKLDEIKDGKEIYIDIAYIKDIDDIFKLRESIERQNNIKLVNIVVYTVPSSVYDKNVECFGLNSK